MILQNMLSVHKYKTIISAEKAQNLGENSRIWEVSSVTQCNTVSVRSEVLTVELLKIQVSRDVTSCDQVNGL